MPFKINIGTKEGKTYKIETESEALVGKELRDKISGTEISPELAGYEFEIAGASDKAGFMSMENVEGVGLKGVLLTYGKGLHKKPKGDKKKNKKPDGMRYRKTVRGKVISPAITQINLKIIKEGAKPLAEVFPEQNKAPEPEAPAEQTAEAPKKEAKPKVPAEEQPTPEEKQAEKEPSA